MISKIAKIAALSLFLLPGLSRAAFVLDTGTPTGSSALIVSSSQFIAGEFSVTAGQTITQLAADLSSVSGNGNSLIIDLYSGPITGSHTQLHLVDSTTTTFNASGWTSANVNWVVPTTGNYWFAIGGNGVGTTYDAPTETSTSTGTVPALAFAFSSGSQYSNLSSGIGMQVNVSVPEPATYGTLAGAGMLAVSLGTQLRRKTA